MLLEHLQDELATLDAPDRAAGAALLVRIRSEREAAQRELVGTLGSSAYRQLLARLRMPPRLADGVEAVPLRRIAGKEFRRLLNAVEQLGKQPADHELHRLRIKLKRARYASELAAPGKQGKRFLDDAKDVQTLLGEHQDAVVAETKLRELVAGLDSAAAFVAGRLVERQRLRREQGQGAPAGGVEEPPWSGAACTELTSAGRATDCQPAGSSGGGGSDREPLPHAHAQIVGSSDSSAARPTGSPIRQLVPDVPAAASTSAELRLSVTTSARGEHASVSGFLPRSRGRVRVVLVTVRAAVR